MALAHRLSLGRHDAGDPARDWRAGDARLLSTEPCAHSHGRHDTQQRCPGLIGVCLTLCVLLTYHTCIYT